MIKSYKDLIVWQKSMKIVTIVYQLTKLFPKEEMYGLTSQLRRAAVSIPSNIAEGQARNTTKEFINFFYIAKGSLAELETQILIAVQLDYLKETEIKKIMDLREEINKMLLSLIKKLQ